MLDIGVYYLVFTQFYFYVFLKLCQSKKGMKIKKSPYQSEPIYEGMLTVILLLQVSSHDFEPTFLYWF